MSSKNLDLSISRILKAPRSAIWQAWKDPEKFVKWFAPAPVITISKKHEFYSGGGFHTSMRLEDGTLMDWDEGCFLQVIENERIIFTDALRGGWRPNGSAFFTAVITLKDHPEGTLYAATALHKSPSDCSRHTEMGFMDGWGKSIEQLGQIAGTLV
ncbi:MAG: SRPBCC family protein [Roseibium sp.]|uniref:SRPBCC family protein n=1 Tax=Roseibium sp. TaxID=1936156 RepID=UPI00262C5A91|nr:SRPBCC family protein [Roseibium sp.]MCV0423946.1 SRPBCC family protein [Roseibium sp.]